MKDEQRIMQTRTERGIAMVLALFLMSALSVLGASMMFLSQTETYATMNYRMMSQARYAAEAGIQRASNFLLDSTLYATPHTGAGGDSIDDNYDITVSPVKCKVGATLCTAGSSIVLSTIAANSNYPDATKKTEFATSAGGSLTAGSATLTYTTVATLLTMQYLESYCGSLGRSDLEGRVDRGGQRHAQRDRRSDGTGGDAEGARQRLRCLRDGRRMRRADAFGTSVDGQLRLDLDDRGDDADGCRNGEHFGWQRRHQRQSDAQRRRRCWR